MGGRPKGLLKAPDGRPIVERWAGILTELGVPFVLVGEAGAYAQIAAEKVADEPPGIGPLGGLAALLRRAGPAPALALACDMPFVSRALIERLRDAPAHAAIVAPRRKGRWEPLCARYDSSRVLPIALSQVLSGERSLQALLHRAGAAELPLSPAEEDELDDWDTPGDISPESRVHKRE
jgi:molybdopterin-guanine dinucleotide biosynthesis protein A